MVFLNYLSRTYQAIHCELNESLFKGGDRDRGTGLYEMVGQGPGMFGWLWVYLDYGRPRRPGDLGKKCGRVDKA